MQAQIGRKNAFHWLAGGLLVAGFLATAATALQAQQAPPAAPPRVQIIRGESSRGVSMALRDAAEKIPAPRGDQVLHFRVRSISGQKSRAGESVVVELEVQDRPFDAPARAD